MALLNIKEIIENDFLSNDRIINIPSFQRGYSWKKKNIQDFLNDIVKIKSQELYFTGFFLIKKNMNIEANFFDLIDGQQRLTTLFITLSVIREHKYSSFAIKKECFELITLSNGECRLHSQEEITNKYIKYILSEGEEPKAESVYYNNMQVAKQLITKGLNDVNIISNERDLTKFFEKITTNMVFNIFEIPNIMNGFKVFEAINQRGERLNKLELVKNKILYLIYALETDNSERKYYENQINDVWQTIYKYLGKDEAFSEEDNDDFDADDIFLRSHTFIYHGLMDRTADEYSNFLFNEYLTDDTTKEKRVFNIKKLINYVDSLKDAIKFWFSINFPKHKDSIIKNEELKNWLIKISYLKKHHFSVLILSLFMKGLSESDILKLMPKFEQFCFIVYHIFCRPISYSRNYIYRAANTIYKGTDEDLSSFMTELSERFIGINGIALFTAAFSNELQALKMNTHNKFWRALDKIEYLLLEYETFLCEQKNGEILISEITNRNIELIYSDAETPAIFWENQFNQVPINERENLMFSLGNLLLVRYNTYGAYTNYNNFLYSPIPKKEQPNSYSKQNLKEKYPEWDKETIIQRGLDILHFLEERWDIPPLGDDDFKRNNLLT